MTVPLLVALLLAAATGAAGYVLGRVRVGDHDSKLAIRNMTLSEDNVNLRRQLRSLRMHLQTYDADWRETYAKSARKGDYPD